METRFSCPLMRPGKREIPLTGSPPADDKGLERDRKANWAEPAMQRSRKLPARSGGHDPRRTSALDASDGEDTVEAGERFFAPSTGYFLEFPPVDEREDILDSRRDRLSLTERRSRRFRLCRASARVRGRVVSGTGASRESGDEGERD